MGEIIGVTGNICSGKTEALRFFEKEGNPVLKTDTSLYNAYLNPQCRQEIIAILGESILGQNGEIDRLLLKKKLLKDPHLTRQLWGITDQYIDPEIVTALKKNKDGMLFFETTQLFEKNWDSYCKKTIFCYAPDEKRASWLQERARVRDGLELTLEKAYVVLRQQTPQEEKLEKADFVIYNNGAIESLENQCRRILGLLKGCP